MFFFVAFFQAEKKGEIRLRIRFTENPPFEEFVEMRRLHSHSMTPGGPGGPVGEGQVVAAGTMEGSSQGTPREATPGAPMGETTLDRDTEKRQMIFLDTFKQVWEIAVVFFVLGIDSLTSCCF